MHGAGADLGFSERGGQSQYCITEAGGLGCTIQNL